MKCIVERLGESSIEEIKSLVNKIIKHTVNELITD